MTKILSSYLNETKLIFDLFEKHNIKTVISRNYEFLLENKTYSGKDIDLCVKKKDLKKIKKIFEENNFIKYPINPFSKHEAYIKFIIKEEKLLFFHLHIDGVTGVNLEYMDGQSIFKNSIKEKYFYKPSINDEFLIIVQHAIIDKKKFRDDYRKKILKLFPKIDHEYITKKLENNFGKKNCEFILKNIKENNFNKIENKSLEMYKYFIKNYKNKYYELFKVYILGGFWKLNWFLTRKPVITFIGLDGTGKTTSSLKLFNILKVNKLRTNYIYFGRGRNNILPIQFLGKIYKKTGGKSSIQTEKKKKTEKYSILLSFAIFIFALDMILRYLIVILPSRMKYDFTISDRSTTDILLFNKVPMSLKKFIYFFMPKPNLIFYLYNDIEVLYKRKKHPIEDLKRQEIVFKNINKTLKPIKIKTIGIKPTIKKILEKII